MQTVASANQRSFAPTPITLLAMLLALCLAPAVGASSIVTSDGHNTLSALPLGSDLHVGAAGLPAGSSITLQLVDWQGQTILQKPVTADSDGNVASVPLWLRTGIGGCDCKLLGDGYPFRYPREARQILGLTVTVQLVAADGSLLAGQDLEIVHSVQPLIFPADLKACPRQLLPSHETLLIVSDGPTGAASVFVVEHRSSWTLGMPFQDLRVGFPQGQPIAASPDGWNEILWQGAESQVGHYDILIRWHIGDPSVPGNLRYGEGDTILRLPVLTPGGRSDGGLVIDDWGCNGPIP